MKTKKTRDEKREMSNQNHKKNIGWISSFSLLGFFSKNCTMCLNSTSAKLH
jgi:hypothetical protein